VAAEEEEVVPENIDALICVLFGLVLKLAMTEEEREEQCAKDNIY
jgi:hypothetical protein